MIVVDTNTIAYLYLPTKFTNSVEELLIADSNWIAPSLWRSELRNILATYLRTQIISLEAACNIQNKAELIMDKNEYSVDSISVLTLAKESGCTAYDCEFISLAKTLDTKLITADKKLIRTFPEIAISASDYNASQS
ncbi:MAG: type II toxin-antitoxin system VapC family toxin [Pseudomonadales bacterium]